LQERLLSRRHLGNLREQKVAILGGNAARLFGMKEA